MPTSQEKCGRVTKKVKKGLNCYDIPEKDKGDGVYYLTICEFKDVGLWIE